MKARGLECDPVLDVEQLWAVSCVGSFDCSAQSFHQSLPLSLRHAPLPPCFQIRFTHCNKAFILSLWCLCCFAAPLHCSPSVKACCCVSEHVQLFDIDLIYTSAVESDGLVGSRNQGYIIYRHNVIICMIYCHHLLVNMRCCFFGD